MFWRAAARKTLRCIGLMALAVTTACASTLGVWEPIAPSEFHFAPVIASDRSGPSGWKAARLIITLVRREGLTSKSVTCRVQVEVPGMNWRGVVTEEEAQLAAASASDTAAERVLGQNLLSAEMCRRYYEEMEQALQELVPGARVKDFADYSAPPARRK